MGRSRNATYAHQQKSRLNAGFFAAGIRIDR